jgi:hypothetical protein
MKCDKCGGTIPEGEERSLRGQTLCEDCLVVLLSPVKACDPWAVHSARSFSDQIRSKIDLTSTQSAILAALKKTGGAPAQTIMEMTQLAPEAFEREFATLRHMEMARAELRDGKKILCLW